MEEQITQEQKKNIIYQERNLTYPDSVLFDYIIRSISTEEYTKLKILKEEQSKDLFLDEINLEDIILYGVADRLSEQNASKIISKTYANNLKWSNIDDYFTSNRLEHQRNLAHYITCSFKTPIEIYYLHLDKLGNPTYCIIFKRKRSFGNLTPYMIKKAIKIQEDAE